MGRSGEHLSPGPATLTARLERAFASRLRDLSPETRAILLAAALDSRASLDEIARSSGQSLESLQPAVDADLVEIADGGVHFRHPLIRSAVRQTAPAQEVLEMYRALADTVADPERRLWHRAMAAKGPDESIASALEQHGRLAAVRGAVTVAGAALQRAAALTADPRSKGARLVAAAEIAYELGLVEGARRLVDEATSFDLSGRDLARVAWFRQILTGSVWFEAGAARTFVTIAEQLLTWPCARWCRSHIGAGGRERKPGPGSISSKPPWPWGWQTMTRGYWRSSVLPIPKRQGPRS